MTPTTSVLRVAAAAGLALLLAGACGGKSLVGEESANGGSSAQGSSSAQGGSSSLAGTTAKGGQVATGGTGGSKGGSSAQGGATSGGYAGEGCTAPPDAGPCKGSFETWNHDPNTGICRPSYYGGCDGNANRYDSLAACQKACSGGTPNYDSCTQPSDCVLDGLGCCGICDSPQLSLHSFIAYNRAYQPGCVFARGARFPIGGSSNVGLPDPVACDLCTETETAPELGARQYFVPDCLAGQCSVTDVRESTVTACKTDDDCRLRRGTSCCEGCDAPLIAVQSDGSFEKLVCGNIIPPCLPCGESPATGALAVCASGRCQVTYLGGDDTP